MESRLSLNDRLGLIGLIDEGMRSSSSASPMVADLFGNLWGLVHATVSGSKIDRLKPAETRRGFHVLEITAESGEKLGHLNMLYLKKPIPCYYLVYVEVAAPFRKKGLGGKILQYFSDYLNDKSAVGILDNIIPPDDPSYTIYEKMGWEPAKQGNGEAEGSSPDNYMVYVPPAMRDKDLDWPLRKLVYHLKRKRAAIDMRDNELMVRQTITEFKELYAALHTYFESDLRRGNATPLMRFMFTRFVTKLISFRRRISELIGYTGGESLEQVPLAREIAALSVQSYSPRELSGTGTLIHDGPGLWERLPEALRRDPSQFIEHLPNYRRPSFTVWLRERNLPEDHRLTIGDLLDMGFDPTRLKEIVIDGRDYIFERIQARQIEAVQKTRTLLERATEEMAGVKVKSAQLAFNPPLLLIGDRGNGYILRAKVEGIHWDEAVEQLQGNPALAPMNKAMKLDKLVIGTARRAMDLVSRTLNGDSRPVLQDMACFVSWDLDSNQPRLMVDFSGSSLDTVWLA